MLLIVIIAILLIVIIAMLLIVIIAILLIVIIAILLIVIIVLYTGCASDTSKSLGECLRPRSNHNLYFTRFTTYTIYTLLLLLLTLFIIYYFYYLYYHTLFPTFLIEWKTRRVKQENCVYLYIYIYDTSVIMMITIYRS